MIVYIILYIIQYIFPLNDVLNKNAIIHWQSCSCIEYLFITI